MSQWMEKLIVSNYYHCGIRNSLVITLENSFYKVKLYSPLSEMKVKQDSDELYELSLPFFWIEIIHKCFSFVHASCTWTITIESGKSATSIICNKADNKGWKRRWPSLSDNYVSCFSWHDYISSLLLYISLL